MMTTPWADGMFAAVTAMSSMEHGFDPERLLDEVVRLLRPGGLFIASTDYWPQKVDTSDVTLYGMTWTIFDRSDVEAFLAIAARKGLHPIGPLDFAADEAPIFVHGKHYTFGWLALEKRAG
jgi:SAM-dependent methyltransferase